MKVNLNSLGLMKFSVDFVQLLMYNSTDGSISYMYVTLNKDDSHIPPRD